jgi:hypothetical protein
MIISRVSGVRDFFLMRSCFFSDWTTAVRQGRSLFLDPAFDPGA